MRMVTCDCGYKFPVPDNSRISRCWECSKKFIRKMNKKKPLDVAFKKIDALIKSGKIKL